MESKAEYKTYINDIDKEIDTLSQGSGYKKNSVKIAELVQAKTTYQQKVYE